MSFKQNQKFYNSANQPSNPNLGDEWLNSSTNRMYQFMALSGSAPQWIETAISTTANTFAINNVTVSGKGSFTGNTSTLALTTTNIAESVSLASVAIAGYYNYNVTSQTILYVTANSTGNFILNITGADGGITLNSLLNIGQSVTCVLMLTNGGSAYYPTAIRVDGQATTVRWQGGSAPTSGNTSAVDSYTFAVVKTANATFNVFAAIAKFA